MKYMIYKFWFAMITYVYIYATEPFLKSKNISADDD